MAETDWKPGDVIAALLDGNEIVGIVRGGGQRVFYADSVTTDAVAIKHLRNVRRLLVIDPEDREQVERLDVAYQAALDSAPKYHGLADVMQQALRAMLAPPKPPKPEEPLGLGAVVVDGGDFNWVRTTFCNLQRPWRKALGDSGDCFRAYADIDAVEVLSQGVTS